MKSMAVPAEKRRYSRYPVVVVARVGRATVFTRNVSRCGLQVSYPPMIFDGVSKPIIRVRMVLPGEGPFEAAYKFIYAKEQDDGHLVGFDLNAIELGDLVKLERAIVRWSLTTSTALHLKKRA
jgi:hypothetical protein